MQYLLESREYPHLSEHDFSSQNELADAVGMSRTRVEQFLYLLRIPGDLRVRLKEKAGLTEGELRLLTKMDGAAMRAAAGRLLGMVKMAQAG